MACVSANLLYVVIYGPVLSCHPDPADNPPDPADGETGGYVRCALVLHEFCVVALSKHTHVIGMTQGSQNCAQIRFMISNGS